MPNYKNSKIYKLISDKTDKIYIGSTIQPLCERKAGHKRSYSRYCQGKNNYISSFDLLQLGNVDIVLLENFSCDSKQELHARERYWIEKNITFCVNKIIPARTKKERYQKDINKILEQKRGYYKTHKSSIRKKQRNYYELNKSKIKLYYENNKDSINRKRKGNPITCECGSTISYESGLTKHKKTIKHITFMKSQS